MEFGSSMPNSLFWHLCILLVLHLSFWSDASCLPDQRSALLRLKEGFSRFNLSSWLPGTDCCHGWNGVACDVSTGHVTALDLSNQNIEGNLSAVIFNLTSLRYLNLAHNNFSGNPIPSLGFEKLTMLTHLNLSYSYFLGQIPIGIANLTKLISLDLSTYGGLTLHKPNLRMLVSNLSNLRELHLDYVNISENGTEWCGALSVSVPLLHVLSMINCNLSGPIQSSLSQLNYLSVIHLSWNIFNSPIPEYFANFPLKDLRLVNSGIKGHFPPKIFQIPTLIILDLSSNGEIFATIPDFPLESSLEKLYLDNTNFSYQIPHSIGNLKNLSILSLSGCNFSGQIPSLITKLHKLVYLDLSDNALSGSIPQNLSALPNLQTLRIFRNKISGEFRLEKESFISNSPLEFLMLSGNQLNGSIPQAIYKFANLVYLDLSSNQFGGPIPNSIFRLHSLQILHLNSNNFSGTVELSLLQYLSNLIILDLSDNQLSLQDISHEQLQLSLPKIVTFRLASCNLSQIPHLIRYHNDLEELDLSNNQLHGDIPSWLWEKFTSCATSLNLSRNMFTGVENISPCSGPLGSCPCVGTIDLSYNKIEGALPLISGYFLDYSNNKFSKIPSNYPLYLKDGGTLVLSKNRLTGEIPSSICKASNLQFLDVSDNGLSGLIPSCIFESPNPWFLNLASNKFQGIIPRNISTSCQLIILDLSNNNLEGDLPRSLTRCKYLVTLDIGNNRITDTFPFWLWELSNLQVSILRSNRLYGALELPARFANNNSLFQNMRIIDLASNNLNGSLPSSLFKNLRSMANLSLNALTTEAFILNTDSNYGIDIRIMNKGIQMILEEHIASIMVEIDLSNNKFTGDIPEIIGTLSALRALNLSHNVLSGTIPRAFKGLTRIESLDLSWNSLVGEIPQELTSIDSLSKLNLSINNLTGRIPQSPHFLTFDNSSFEGNPKLCGVPLSKQCNVTNPGNNSTTLSTTSEKITAVVLLCLFIGLGFGIGFAFVIIWSIIRRAIKR